MSIERYKSPAEIFESSWKPYHSTGEATIDGLLENIPKTEFSLLQTVSEHLYSSAKKLDTELNILVVGSAANLNVLDHVDIDLLVAPKNKHVRNIFPNHVEELLRNDTSLCVKGMNLKKATLEYKTLWAPRKLFIVSWENYSSTAIDVTFVETNSGTFDEFLHFHQKNDLAFCELNDSLLKTS